MIVIGASATGLFAAYKLAQAGIPVTVFEAQPALDPAPRTLIVTPAWLRLLDFDVSEAILNRTTTFDLISRSASTSVSLREPDVVLERARFLQLLAHHLRRAGGHLLLDHRFEGLDHAHPFPLVRFRNSRGPETRPAPSLVGADGVASAVANELQRADVPQVGIAQARVPLPPDLPPHTVRCWFHRHSTRFFYWLIPESPRTGAVGLIAETEAQAERELNRFMADRGLEPLDYQGASVPMFPPGVRLGTRLGTRPAAQLAQGRALLVGDSAGQVKATTVGGVVTGMRGGAAAARAILNDTSYAAESRALRWELRAHAALRRLLDTFTDADYDHMLHLLNAPTRRVIRQYHRDELRRSLWRLLLAQPRWSLLATRALLKGLLPHRTPINADPSRVEK